MKKDQRKVTRIKIKHRNHHYNCKERIPSHLKNISYQSAIIMIHCKFYVYQYFSEIVKKKDNFKTKIVFYLCSPNALSVWLKDLEAESIF